MSDGGLTDSLSKSNQERADETPYARTVPGGTKPYNVLEHDLGERNAEVSTLTKEHAKKALEDLYHNEFPIDDPPESWERYEAEMVVRHLRYSIQQMFSSDRASDRELLVDVTADGSDLDVTQTGLSTRDDSSRAAAVARDLESELLDIQTSLETRKIEQRILAMNVEQAKNRIDVMQTYGQVAEPHVAALTYIDIHSDVRAYATETLAEMRSDESETKSLTAAIRDWWRGE